MFVKQAMQQLADGAASNTSDLGQRSQATGAKAAASVPQRKIEGSRPASRGNGKQARGTSRQCPSRPPRLQHDDPFLAYDITVA